MKLARWMVNGSPSLGLLLGLTPSAIAMAEDGLAKSGDSFVRSISGDILCAQSDEIRQFSGLLWGDRLPPTSQFK
ncbi:DUF305 domain-containing protein [Synechococcus elongatus]|nr:DUF305 domain-containing protein [Synechococcus elongatus]WKW04565.1 DUF305 domain-containing protein [Synechococcus elongatus PCC 7942 = FACHB-805]